MIPIGVVGPTASGKGTLCNFIQEKFNAETITLSDIIKSEARKRNIDPNIRENLQKLGDELREVNGPDVLAKLALQELNSQFIDYGFFIDYGLIDGVRSVSELEFIKNCGGYVIGLDGELKERHTRHISRHEKKDDIFSFEEFQKKDESDRFGDPSRDKKYTRSVENCLSSADYLIWNGSSSNEKQLYELAVREANEKQLYEYEHLYDKIIDFIKLIEGNKRRPNWEELFMYKAYISSQRSSCLRRKVGATLVRENREIASGYNGQAAGMKHCKDLKCIREEMKIPSGERRELCRAMHAELNAILQCAVYGPSTEGATLYVSNSPCSDCTKVAMQTRLKEVVYFGYYPDKFAEQMWRDSPSTKFRRFEGVMPNWYSKVF